MRINKFILSALFCSISFSSMAKDITGIWKNIDDKTGSSKAVLEIRKESNGTFTGKIIKVTPRPGYTPKETCIDCPAPYTNKPILGMDVLKNLKQNNEEGNLLLRVCMAPQKLEQLIRQAHLPLEEIIGHKADQFKRPLEEFEIKP